jgi:hypothetical protein
MLRRLLNFAFGPPPLPWERPRFIGELDEYALYHQLQKRLDQASALHEGLIYFRDRETGQLWREQLQEDSPAPAYCLHPVHEIPTNVPPGPKPPA